MPRSTTTLTILGAVLLAALLTACAPSRADAQLTPDTPTRVYTGETQIYTFEALPDAATVLRVAAEPVDLAYSADVFNGAGQPIATLRGGVNAQVTVPANSGSYEVHVTTEESGGTVELFMNRATQIPPASDTLALATAQSLGSCEVSGPPGGANVYDTPSPTSDPFGSLPEGRSLLADARAVTNDAQTWYRVGEGETIGWMPGTTITLSGPCAALPLVSVGPADTAAPATGGPVNYEPAPFDVDSYDLPVDPHTGAFFEEQISYPDGDQIDRIWLSAANFDAATDTQRVFRLNMLCEGEAATALRWGPPEQPMFGCESAIETTFNSPASRMNLVVTLPEGGLSGGVRYRLEVSPAAPADDDAVLFPLDRDSGGQISGAISYPGGDRTDTLVMRVENLVVTPPDDHRHLLLHLTCDGANATSLRWGPPDTASLGCGQTASLSFTATAFQKTVAIAFPDGSNPGYLNYTLHAVPIAPADIEAYEFRIDRNAGGQFGETVSHPGGDPVDLVQIAMANLADTPPNNYREVQVTLLCAGTGAEFVRWGGVDRPSMGCGATTIVPMLAGFESQTFSVTLPDESGSAYINYTILARPVLAQPEPPPAQTS